ncbi:MAG: glycosyltransferase family 4 protein [bacterium]|nr:glycosyltransferase family 4 protein [bacterium]
MPLPESLADRRVALVHDWLTGMRGGEKVLEAIAELFPDAPIYTLIHLPGSVSDALESHPIHTSYLQRAPGVRRHYRHYLPLFPSAIEDFDLGAYDLILSTSHCVAKGVIPAPDAYHLCYCHTPMRYAWDQEHTYFPRRRGLVARLRQLVLSRLRAWDAAAVPRVDCFVANSRFVAGRIGRYYGREAEVVPPPVDVDFFLDEDDDAGGETGDYCLVVTALAPYKRVELAIAACERLGLELRLIGSGPERRRLERLTGAHTRFLGRVSDDDLRRQLRGARMFLQPGVEDFGISSVEALACGTPVVAAGRGGILDIVENEQHGVLYELPPGGEAEAETTALAAAIDKSRNMRFNKLKLKDRARSFSAQRFTQRILSTLSEHLVEPDRSPGSEGATPGRNSRETSSR